MRRQSGARRPPGLLSPEERGRLEELTASRIQRMRKSRLEVLEAWFRDQQDASNGAIARRLGLEPRAVMALTRRTVREVRLAGTNLWEKAKRRADAEWGPACRDEVLAQGIQATLDARVAGAVPCRGRPQDAERSAATAPAGTERRARQIEPVPDLGEQDGQRDRPGHPEGRATAASALVHALTEILRQAEVKRATYIGNVIRWAGYETTGEYVVFDRGNRPRIQMMLREHPAGISADEIAERTGIDLQRVKETLRNDHYAVRTRPGSWTLAGGESRPFTNVRTAIQEIIARAGGQASEEGIINELENKYGTRPATARTITRTRDFVRLGGTVRENPGPEAWSGELAEQADGFSDNGEPYIDWHARGKRAERQGLRIHGIPEVVAHLAGGRPNSTTRLAVTSPPGLGDVTLRWSTGEGSPVTLRRAHKALKALGTEPEDLIRITLTRSRTIAFENLGHAGHRRPEPRRRAAKYPTKGRGPASRALTGLVADVLAGRQWTIHTAASRLGMERQALYNLLGGAETTVDRADAACRRMGIELRIGIGGPTGQRCEPNNEPPTRRPSERLQELLRAAIGRHQGKQAERARRLAIPTSWIQASMRGDIPRLERAQQVAEALGTTLALGQAGGEETR